MNNHKIEEVFENKDIIKVQCSCGWSTTVNERFLQAIKERHMKVNTVEGNTK